MEPAVDADLRAMRESLERLAEEEELPAAAEAVLREVRRSLQRLERTWARVLPYLVAENTATAALLSDLARLAPPQLRDELSAIDAPSRPVPDAAHLDALRANQLNGVLRGLLARLIAGLPANDAGAEARARAHRHLLSALKLRPW
jgi:hypothetical protein